MEKLFDDINRRTGVVERLVKNLQSVVSETESRRADSIRESAAEKTMLEKKLGDLELREKEFESYREEKQRELAAKVEELRLKREEVRLGEAKLDESMNERRVCLEVAQNEVESIRLVACEKLREIESQERELRSAQELLAARERHLLLKEEKLSVERGEFVQKLELAEDKLREREKSWHDFMESLRIRLDGMGVAIDRRFEESVEEADLIRESMEGLFNEFEKMKRQFTLIQEEKMRELESKEQQLHMMNEELLAHVKLRDYQLAEFEKLWDKLLKRFEVAENNAKGLKKIFSDRFTEISSREIEIACNMHLVEKKRGEVDSKAKRLEEREKEIKTKEVNIETEEIKFQTRSKELDLKEKNLESWEKELDLKRKDVDSAQEVNEQLSTQLDWKEKNLNSMRNFVRSCFKDHLSFKRNLRIDRGLVEKHARHVERKEQRLECKEQKLERKEQELERSIRELKVKKKQIRDRCKELELEQQQLNDALNAPIKIVPVDSADIIFVMKMDGKALQMFLNDPEKDLEVMCEEIFKVLHLSSNPAKLVLDAMSGFYPPHLRKGDMELNVRKTCILLLEQLMKMRPTIHPSVREEAFELASEWRTKMRITAENPLEVSGFLHLLAAYNLASYFDEKLLCSLTKIAQHKETPEFCCALGLSQVPSMILSQETTL